MKRWVHHTFHVGFVLSMVLGNCLGWANELELWQGLPGIRPSNPSLSLQLHQADIETALRMVAKEAGFNVVVAEGVKGQITLDWSRISWMEAWNALIQLKGLKAERSGQVVVVSLSDESMNNPEAIHLNTRRFRLNFAKAEEVAKQMMQERKASAPNQKKSVASELGLLSGHGQVWVDARTNQLFVADRADTLQRLEEWIVALDIPVQQVVIEARVVEADRSFAQSLGARWSAGTGGSVQTPDMNQPGVSAQVGMPASAGHRGEASSLAWTLLDVAKSRFLHVELSAMQEEGKGKIVANPSIVTSDQVKALVEQGTEFPYVVQSEQGASIEFRKATLRLEVLPHITPDGGIILGVDIHKDSPGEITASGVAIHTKHVRTQVLVENGGTLMIGGIYETQQRQVQSRVPGLGDLPWIGRWFSQSGRQSDSTEMLVFLTPRVVERQ